MKKILILGIAFLICSVAGCNGLTTSSTTSSTTHNTTNSTSTDDVTTITNSVSTTEKTTVTVTTVNGVTVVSTDSPTTITTKTPTTVTTKAPTTVTTKTPTTVTTKAPTTVTTKKTTTGSTTTHITTVDDKKDECVTEYYGYNESIYLSWNDTNANNSEVYYKKTTASTYTKVDKELTRYDSTTGVCDIVGISAGNYDVKVIPGDTATPEIINNVSVTAHDRSGYAHFNYSKGVGAYNDNGTPKTGAVIIYVTDETKNTVTYSGKTGIGEILSDIKGSTTPIIVRFIGTIKTQSRDADGSKKTDKAAGITALAGLTDSVLSKDSYFNMLDVAQVSNLTIEGIGNNAEIFQWGFTFKKCNSIEVRNLTFTDYPEDACSFEGDTSKVGYGNYWVHNNKFNRGKNLYDLTEEQDKHYGDGATDLKGIFGATLSYNEYNNCKKTGLIGGSNSNKQYNITLHHNYYNCVSSRLPLVRQANLHMYNNYFYKISSSCVSLRAGAYGFIEANYFEDSANPFTCKVGEGYDNGEAKLYQNIIDSGCFYNSEDIRVGVEVTSRTATVSNKCTYGQTFDTDSSKFYYDATNKKTNVTLLTSANQAKIDCVEMAGPKGGNINGTSSSGGNSGGNTGDEPIGDISDASVLDLSSLPSNITSTTNAGDFTIVYGSKTMSVASRTVSTNGITSNTALKFGGGGTTSDCCIKFTIADTKTIKIIATSTGSTERTVNISNGSSVVNTAAAGVSATYTTFQLTAGTYYVYSAGSGIYINYLSFE